MSLSKTEAPKESTQFVIDELGKVFKEKIVRSEVVNPIPAFKDYAQTVGTFLPMLAPGSFMRSEGESYTLFQSFRNLQFRTTYSAHKTTNPDTNAEELILSPIWRPEEGVHRIFTWTAPDNYRLVLKLNVKKNGTPGTCVFLMYHRDGTFFHVPTPNVHGDGKLCTGSLVWNHTEGLDTLLSSYFNSWADNTWNADLLGNNGSSTHYRDIIRFAPDGVVLPPIPEKTWEKKLNKATGDNVGESLIKSMKEFFTIAHPNPESDTSFDGPFGSKEKKEPPKKKKPAAPDMAVA